MKKVLILAVVCIAFFVSCQNPFAPQQGQTAIPAGKGSLSLRVDGDFARTIVPDTADEANAILAYRLIFTDEDQAVTSIDLLSDELSDPILLEAGTYELCVIGYSDEGWQKPVAEGSPDPNEIIITAGKAATCTVTLAAYGVAGGEGSFYWNITLPEVLSGAAMAIEPLLPDGTAAQTLNLLGSESPDCKTGSVVLASGYYQVTLTLKKADSRDITWYETLHVYQNLASCFIHEFGVTDFNSKKFTVIFDYNYDAIAIRQTRVQGNTAGEPSEPTRTGYTFDGWYTDNGTFANEWNFATAINEEDKTLYAKWLKNLTVVPGTPGRTLIPIDSADALYGTTAAFGVTITGLAGTDTVTVSMAPGSGLTLSGNTGVGASGTLTITYDGSAVTPSPAGDSYAVAATALTISGSVTNTEKYLLIGSPSVSVSIIDGRASTRPIPVTQANVLAFNVYANTTPGLTRHYRQTQDITLDAPIAPATSNWTAIGDNSTADDNTRFTGNYDGSGHTISNLTINASTGYQGMFGYIVTGGTVKNLGLADAIITIDENVNNIGSIAGYNTGKVFNCYASGAITCSNSAGGIVGCNGASGIVSNCYATGAVSSGNAGGVVGANYGKVSNCYASGAVKGTRNAGGIVGLIANGTVEYCMALNAIVINSTDVGRIAGNFNSGTFSNNYAWNGMAVMLTWNGTTGNPKAIIGNADNHIDGAGITASAAKGQAAWETAGFAFGTTESAPWEWQNGKMPRLYWETEWRDWPVWLLDQGSGTSTDPFKVYDVTTLQRVGTETGEGNWTLSAHYVQYADIDMTGQSSFTAIGTYANQFTGTYDGGGHVIENLTINASAGYQGMFGAIGSGGVVQNLGLIGNSVTAADSFAGGIAGYNTGTVFNCYAAGAITSTNCAGGIVGVNFGTVSGCYATGAITANNLCAGGITGYNIGTASNCYATGVITAANYAGGIAGINGGTVSGCYATGAITAANYAGGIAGYNGVFELGGNGMVVEDCMALNPSVTITAVSDTDAGRVVGINFTYTYMGISGTSTNNYAWSGMAVQYNTSTTKTITTTGVHDGIDGEGILASIAQTQAAWTTAGFAFGTTESAPWEWQNGKMPRLYWETEWRDWPF